MGGIFRLDSPFMNFLGKMADLMILNIVTMICCIPVFTAGAALTAMFSVLLKMVRNEEPTIVKSYFSSFKENFKQSTIMWLIMLVIIAFLAFDFYMFMHDPTGDTFPKAIKIMVIAVSVIMVAGMLYIFPLQCRFINPIKRTIRNAFFVSVANFPITVAIIVIYIVIGLIFIALPEIMPIAMMMGVTLPSYFASMLINSIFKKFEPKEETTDEYVPLSIFSEENEKKEETKEEAVVTEEETKEQ